MRTIILAAFLLLFLFAGASGTKEKFEASYQTTQNFITEFGMVENVQWSKSFNDMSKADFVLNDEPVSAYFDTDGEFVAYTRELAFNDFPKSVKTAINQKLPGARVLKSFEMSTRIDKTWFVETLLNNQRKLWKIDKMGKVSRYFIDRS